MSGISGREHSLGIGVENGQCGELLAVAGMGGEGGGGLTGRGCSPLNPYPALWEGLFKPWVLCWNGWDPLPPWPLPSSLSSLARDKGVGEDSGGRLSDASFPSTGRALPPVYQGPCLACCLLEREVGEIIVSPREEIWA